MKKEYITQQFIIMSGIYMYLFDIFLGKYIIHVLSVNKKYYST